MIGISVVVVIGGYMAWQCVSVPKREPIPDTGLLKFNYPLNKAGVDFFLKGDSFETLAAGSPFYSGAQALPCERDNAYEKARAGKIREIISTAEALARSTARLDGLVAKLRDAELDCLGELTQEDPTYEQYARECVRQMAAARCARETASAAYESVRADSGGPLVRSYMEYAKVIRAQRVALAYLQELDIITNLAAVTALGSRQHAAFTVWSAGDKLDKAMASLGNSEQDLRALVKGMNRVRWGLKQLRTGDYHFARAVCGFIEKSSPRLEAELKNTRVRGCVTDEDIKFAGTYLKALRDLNKSISAKLDAVDRKELAPVKQTASYPIDCAWAADSPENYTAACDSLSAPIDPPAGSDDGVVTASWLKVRSGAKAAYHGAKWVGQKAQRVVQFTADTMGSYARCAARVPAGILAGSSTDEIMTDIASDAQEIEDNWNGTLPEHSVLKDADHILESIDNTGEWIGSKGVAAVAGEGNASWLAGKVTKAVAGVFTGLGRGIYRLSDPRSTNAELAAGSLDVILSAIGGSKVVVKASSALGGAARESSELAGVFGQYLSVKLTQANIRAMRQEMGELLTREAAADLPRARELMREIWALEGAQKLLRENADAMIAAMRERFASAIGSAPAGTWTEVKNNLREFYETYFRRMGGTMSEQFYKTIGRNPTEVFDNLAGEVVEDLIQDEVEKAATGDPEPYELVGQWTMTLRITGHSPIKSEDEAGRRIVPQITNKDLVFPIRLAAGSHPSAGKFTLVAKNGENGELAYVYDAGCNISASGYMKKVETKFSGKVTRDDSGGLRMSGTVKLSASGEYATGTWSAAKPKK